MAMKATLTPHALIAFFCLMFVLGCQTNFGHFLNGSNKAINSTDITWGGSDSSDCRIRTDGMYVLVSGDTVFPTYFIQFAENHDCLFTGGYGEHIYKTSNDTIYINQYDNFGLNRAWHLVRFKFVINSPDSITLSSHPYNSRFTSPWTFRFVKTSLDKVPYSFLKKQPWMWRSKQEWEEWMKSNS